MYKSPKEFTSNIIDSGQSKFSLSKRDTVIRGFMAGAILGLSAMFAITISINTGQPLLGAVLFPVGFCMLYLMGYDLLTGVFMLTPLALLDKRKNVTFGKMLKNWLLVFIGNFLGAFTVAFMMAFILTYGFNIDAGVVGQKVSSIGESRTLGYAQYGVAGWLTIFMRGVCCNWMVSTGVVGAMISNSVSGKVISMWMPIMLFFYMRFEHSVVNMFLFPFALILGADFSIVDYLIWNEIPTVLGNLLGGIIFAGLPLYLTHYKNDKN